MVLAVIDVLNDQRQVLSLLQDEGQDWNSEFCSSDNPRMGVCGVDEIVLYKRLSVILYFVSKKETKFIPGLLSAFRPTSGIRLGRRGCLGFTDMNALE